MWSNKSLAATGYSLEGGEGAVWELKKFQKVIFEVK